MPVALILIGVILFGAGLRGKMPDLGKLLAGDFTGPKNFWFWFVSIFIIGSAGYYAPLRSFSRLFLVLIVLSMFLADKGMFAQLQSAIANAQPSAANTGSGNAASSGGGGGSGGLGDLIKQGVGAAVSNIPGAGAIFGSLFG